MSKIRRSWPVMISILAFAVLLIAMIVWGALAIYYSYLPETVRTVLSVIYLLGSLAILAFLRPRWFACGAFFILFAIVIFAWFSIKPSNNRDWQPDVALLPYATIEGDLITVHNIRNFDYRSETDYTVRHYDKTFNLSGLSSVDLYLVDWGLKYLVHTMVSFGFKEDQYLCISIETRREMGEGYSTIKGFFRQYELFYVVADERDVVRLRTNFREGETVYLYRIKGGSIDVGRDVFLDYMRYINRLKEKPEWYNALTGNCTTEIRGHTRPYTGRTRWDWRILANGYVDKMAYESGSLDRALPFDELKQRSVINARASAAGKDPAFSKRIRLGLPGF